MEFLPKPDLGEATPLKIFIECVNRYTGKPGDEESKRQARKKRARLTECGQAVEKSGDEYENNVPHKPFHEAPFPADVTPEELAAVYEDKFLTTKAPDKQTYYEKIRRTRVCDKCPISGGTGTTILDHYLPKSSYPTLCVNPNNLIPICDTCNTEKSSTEYTYDEGLPLHMYYDYFPVSTDVFGEEYIEAFLFAEWRAGFDITFHIECPAGWEAEWEKGLFKRLQNHFKMYRLCERYSRFCVSAFRNINDSKKTLMKSKLLEEARKANKDPKSFMAALTDEQRYQYEVELLRHAIEDGINRESHNLNTWQSAFYRALKSKEEILAVRLRENEDLLYEGVRREPIKR